MLIMKYEWLTAVVCLQCQEDTFEFKSGTRMAVSVGGSLDEPVHVV